MGVPFEAGVGVDVEGKTELVQLVGVPFEPGVEKKGIKISCTKIPNTVDNLPAGSL